MDYQSKINSIQEIPNKIEKLAKIAGWTFSGGKYSFTVTVCPLCKVKTESILPVDDKYSYIFHTKEKIDDKQTIIDISDVWTSNKQVTKVNNILKTFNYGTHFGISKFDFNEKTNCFSSFFNPKKIYLNTGEYGDDIHIDIKKENHELHVDIVSSEWFPGECVTMGASLLSHPIDKDIKKIVFTTVTIPLKCSCEIE